MCIRDSFGADVADLAQCAVNSEGDPETGTQGENQFDAVAVDRAEGGQRGVVHDPHVSTRRLAKFVLEREALPLCLEIGIDVRGHPAGS